MQTLGEIVDQFLKNYTMSVQGILQHQFALIRRTRRSRKSLTAIN